MGVPLVGISGLPRQNDIWVLVPWLGIEYTIRGKVVASFQSRSWWILWVCICSWFVYAPKCSNYVIINLLFGLCRFVWMIELLINLPSPILELQHAPLPPKCCEPRSVPQFLSFRCFHLWTRNWVHQGAWGCITTPPYTWYNLTKHPWQGHSERWRAKTIVGEISNMFFTTNWSC